ncbi:MAG: hypothetical protein V1803_01520 [Candidatus Roizmanbacteria bacterium]
MSFNKKLLFIISIISIIFFLFVGFNTSPFLRGPGEWPPDWRWPYLFVNTLNRIWLPLVVIAFILFLYYFLEKKRVSSWTLLILLVVLSYFFQLSVLYFSRSGISVLIHRIINPDLNGYFTEAVKIKNLGEFLANYQKNVLSFSMHATGHPPGPIIFFWLIEKIINVIPLFQIFIVNLIPKHLDVQSIWNNLTLSQRSTAVFSAFFIPFLGSLNIIPLFFIAKNLYNLKTAIRTGFLSVFIPALILFTPLFDVLFPLFFLCSFFFFIKGLKEKNSLFISFSGLIFSLGLFFSLSLLPLIFIYFYYFISNKKFFIPFLAGILSFYLLLFLSKYNVILVSYTLMTGLPKNRSYLTWIFYNLYDFFVFAGIPVAITYLVMFFKKIKEPLFVSFTLMFLLLNFSGAVRGEVGRIWLPLMFPLTLVVNNFLTNKLKLLSKDFLVILFIQAVQILLIQEFWVTLW